MRRLYRSDERTRRRRGTGERRGDEAMIKEMHPPWWRWRWRKNWREHRSGKEKKLEKINVFHTLLFGIFQKI